MSFVGRWKVTSGAVAAAAALGVGLSYPAVPAGAAAGGGVSPSAAPGTPQLNKVGAGKANQEVIRELVQCGGTMYAVGRFSSIQHGTTYTRNNIFSFKATAPFTMTSWAPNVNGQVNAIAFNGSNCSNAYIGGSFTSINGTAVSNIAEISTSSGNVVSSFGHSANNEVWTMVYAHGHLLTGGDFHFINGSKNPFMASLSPSTGKDDGFIHLNISGDYQYCAKGGKPCVKNSGSSQVYNQQVSHTGNLDLVEGRFTSVGGQPRQQIFMLNIGGAKASVTGWTSPEWDGSNPGADPYYQCWPSMAFYVRSAAWSPGDSTVYLANTGFKPAQNPGPGARKGLCDSVSAWPATQAKVSHKWVEYSGCDSYYSVAADSASVYAAGHPRWANNPNACNAAGTGAFPDQGLQGLDPGTGIAQQNGSVARYTMTRANAGYMLITGAGLWIGSTNRYTLNRCGNTKARHAGICFLPY